MARIRIKSHRVVKAASLVPHPLNWRVHPEGQRSALAAALDEIGYVSELVVRELPDGRLELIDGHLRADISGDEKVPVGILDLDDEETKKVLATLDPIGGMAETELELYRSLLADTRGTSEALEEYLESIRQGLTASVPEASAASEPLLLDNYLVTVEVPAAFFEEFRTMIAPWKERDGVTVNISSPN